SSLGAGPRPSPAEEDAIDIGEVFEPAPGDASPLPIPDYGTTFGSPEAARGVGAAGPAAGDGRSMADAFAALLDAERRDDTPPAPGAPVVDERLIEEIVTRVVQRLADEDVRAMVADIVSRVAERAVREEIARLKASL
ncbi:MAG: hypothetical protein KGN76_02595, partial [Acidobacteriota bacterium]|nr:hypothetical protein [Acidobacteriota bacterium]